MQKDKAFLQKQNEQLRSCLQIGNTNALNHNNTVSTHNNLTNHMGNGAGHIGNGAGHIGNGAGRYQGIK